MFILEEKAVCFGFFFFAIYKGLNNTLDRAVATAFMLEISGI